MSNLNESARDARNKYHREWRSKNKDKVKQIQMNYWIRKAQQSVTEEDSNESNKND